MNSLITATTILVLFAWAKDQVPLSIAQWTVPQVMTADE
jgi:hypothetical protein